MDVNVQERPLDDAQRQQLEKQAAEYEERLKKDDKDAAALEGGGSTYAVMGSYDKAVALLTRLTQTKPEESSSWRLLVQSCSPLVTLCGFSHLFRPNKARRVLLLMANCDRLWRRESLLPKP